jgi:hypothetical protein
LLRLAIIPMLSLEITGAMFLALLMTIVALCSYAWAVTIPSLIVLRIFTEPGSSSNASSMALAVHLVPGSAAPRVRPPEHRLVHMR